MHKIWYSLSVIIASILLAPVLVTAAQAQDAKTFQASHLPFNVYSTLDFKTPQEKLLLAYDAYVAKNAARLNRVHASLENSPFEGYLDAWELLLAVEADPGNAETNADARAFLEAHKGEYVAERFATDYLSFIAPSLHKSDNWKTFENIRAGLRWNHDAENLRCWNFYHKVTTSGAKAWPAIIASSMSLMTQAKMYDITPCVRGADILIRNNPSLGTDLLLAAIANNRQARARQILNILAEHKGFPAAEARLALSNPTKWFNTHRKHLATRDKRVILIAAHQLSRVNIEKSVIVADAAAKKLSTQESATLWSRIGYLAALNHMPKSLPWYAKAGTLVCKGAPIINKSACRLWQVRAALRTGDFKTVLDLINRLPPDLASDSAWIYWKGRALDKLGKKDAAKAEFNRIKGSRSYYGKLASEALGIPVLGPSKTTSAVSPKVRETVALSVELQRAQTFYDLGLVNEGHREWNWSLAGNSPEVLLGKALWARDKGITHRMINTAERVRGLPIASDIYYPRPYLDTIAGFAATNGIDISWIYGVIRQESRFIVNARSRVGANGLMQLMPATAQWVASQIGLSRFRPENVTDPSVNLRLGTAYLRLLLDRLENNTVLATAGYNAGPHRAVAWRRTLVAPVEGAIFVETIPFDETRVYVQNVLVNTIEYSRFTERPKSSLIKMLGTISPTKSAFSDPI